MTLIHLVRHGHAAAGWDTSMDPPLDELGRDQAAATAARLVVRLQESKWSVGDLDVVTSPLLRCRETAAEFERVSGCTARIEPRIAEIPSPSGVELSQRSEWLRRAMQGTWRELIDRDGTEYATFRAALVAWAGEIRRDTIAFTHFVAINALIGAATSDDRVLVRSVDNASVTTLHVDVSGRLTLSEGGAEANTDIR